ncbi:MAG: aldehyde dehydrogenase family protein, partial [Pseudomonadota bacterium]
WVNTYRSASMMSPAGGFKDSGYGKHNGFEAMREYSRLKNVVIDYSGASQDAFVMRVK